MCGAPYKTLKTKKKLFEILHVNFRIHNFNIPTIFMYRMKIRINFEDLLKITFNSVFK